MQPCVLQFEHNGTSSFVLFDLVFVLNRDEKTGADGYDEFYIYFIILMPQKILVFGSLQTYFIASTSVHLVLLFFIEKTGTTII